MGNIETGQERGGGRGRGKVEEMDKRANMLQMQRKK